MNTSRTATGSLAPPGVTEIVRIITARPTIRGKSLFVGGEKFIARGVTYGPCRPDDVGCTYHNPDIVSRDFAQMAEAGINTLRTYTCPPRWLLDVAAQHGLRVLA